MLAPPLLRALPPSSMNEHCGAEVAVARRRRRLRRRRRRRRRRE
jgi:hypothetical protein